MERWSSWFTYPAFLTEVAKREGMVQCDVQIHKMSSSPIVFIHTIGDVDIWQGPAVLEMEIRNMEQVAKCSRDMLFFRFLE
jgi:hypothetical protein